MLMDPLLFREDCVRSDESGTKQGIKYWPLWRVYHRLGSGSSSVWASPLTRVELVGIGGNDLISYQHPGLQLEEDSVLVEDNSNGVVVIVPLGKKNVINQLEKEANELWCSGKKLRKSSIAKESSTSSEDLVNNSRRNVRMLDFAFNWRGNYKISMGRRNAVEFRPFLCELT
ncbi:hypothetical protein ACH5RR_018440 [Cinchona calisaya]|uniref:Uncharacterized protein n=1 Tax=Cinchona calisaya TaxID=153742 RepID=A0ABD2ZLK3_9GENT